MKKIFYSTVLLLFHITLMNAQTVTRYVFTPSVGTFTALTGANTANIAAGNFDEGYANNIPIGFSFIYNSTSYTTLSISTNGYVCLGQSITQLNSFNNNLTTGTAGLSPRPIIAPLWDDMQYNNASDMSYLTTGTAPNRVFTAQWLNVRWQYNATAAGISFQLKLYEADERIEFIYRPESGALLNPSASIGITNSATGSRNFLCLTSVAGLPFDTNTVTETTNINVKPSSGQRFTLAPYYQTPANPGNVTFTGITPTAMTINWVDSSVSETYFRVFVSTDNINYTPAGVVSSSTTLGQGGTYQLSLSSLSMGTLYYYRIFPCNEGSISTNYAQASQSTQAGNLSGVKTICPTGCDYTSIGAARTDILAQGVNGLLTLELDATYNPSVETYPLVMGNLLTNANNRVLLRPRSNVTSAIVMASGTAVTLDLNQTRYFTIDGRAGGTGTTPRLVISNINGSGAAVRFINDALFDTIRYCVINGANSNITSGVVFFSTTNGTMGNSFNAIVNCAIKDTFVTPIYSIYSLGTAAYPNIGNTISNCNIYNFFNGSNISYGIYLTTGTSNWSINANHIYQTLPRTMSFNTAGAVFVNAGTAYSFSGNYFGGSAPNCAGAPTNYSGNGSFIVMNLNTLSTGTTLIQNNVIQNYDVNLDGTQNSVLGLFNGTFNVSGNVIGDASTTSSIRFVSSGTNILFSPILVSNGTTFGNVDILNNQIAGISVAGLGTIQFRGIYINANVPNLTIASNTIGSLSIANSISDSTNNLMHGISLNVSSANNVIANNTIANLYMASNASTNPLYGITTLGSTGAYNISGNTVANLYSASTMANAGNVSIIGIQHLASGTGQLCALNRVYNLVNTSPALNTLVTGIFFQGGASGTNTVQRNTVTGLVCLSSGNSNLTGIYNNVANGVLVNNVIRLGFDTAGNAISSNHAFAGIVDAANATSYFFNTVYIGGSGIVNSINSSIAFYNATNTSGTRFLYNNVFVNNRSNTSGTAKHYSVYFTSANLTGLTVDYNLYFGNGSGYVMAGFNATDYAQLTTWRAAIVNDFHSGFASPNFVAASNASSSNMSLKVQSPTPIEGSGLLINGINDDFEGDVRASNTPTDMGADAGNYTALDIFTPVITYNALTNTSSTSNLTFTANISDVGTGVRMASGLAPRVWYRRTSPTISAWISTAGTLVSGNRFDGTWSFTIDYTTIGGASLNNVFAYYVVAQDSASTPNFFYNPLLGASHTDVNTQITPPTTPNTYSIVAGLPTTISVGAGQTYTSLTNAGGLFSAINGGALSGNTNVTIVSDITETGTVILQNNGLGGFTLNIRPDNTRRTLSGAFTSSASALISLNGARNVVIDGGVSQNLVIRNSVGTSPSNAVAPTIWIQNGSFDTIRNCIIEGHNSLTYLSTIYINTSNSSINSNGIVLSGNIIRPPLNANNNAPACAVFLTGNITNAVVGGLGSVPGNSINDYTSFGIYASTQNNLTIGHPTDTFRGNAIFQTLTRSGFNAISVNSGNSHVISSNKIYSTAGVVYGAAITAINIGGGLNGIAVNNNSIGGSNGNRTGGAFSSSFGFSGILLGAGTLNTSSINANNISSISCQDFTGISVSTGNVNIGQNMIGGRTLSGVSSDSIACSGGFYGIRNLSGGSLSISNNTISNILNSGTNASSAISVEAGTASITGNTVNDLTTSSTSVTDPSNSCNAIRISSATSGNVISGNTIYNLFNTSTNFSVTVSGIAVTGSISNSSIAQNRIYNLLATSGNNGNVSPVIYGIYIGASGSMTVANNQVSISQSRANTQPRIRGIELNTGGGNNFFFYNAVYIGGTASNNNTTSCFYRNTSTSAALLTLNNNIFYNERTIGGPHYTVSANSATNLTNNANYFVGTGASPIELPVGTSVSLATWNASTGNPNKNINNTNTQALASQVFPNLASGNLASTLCRVSNAGVPVAVTTDFSNATRDPSTPDIGSTEFTVPTGSTAITQNVTAPAALCASGGTASLQLNATGFSLSYQWLLNNGSGWTPVSNTAPFNGATTSNLVITNPSVSYNANRFLCQVTGLCSPVLQSDSVTLNVHPVITGNSVSPNQLICTNTTPSQVNGATPSGGTGTYTYTWQSSTTASNSGFSTAQGTSNTISYQPGSLSQNTWYRRAIVSGGCSDTSNAIQISVANPGTWTGGLNNAWGNIANWSCPLIPTQSTDVIIPSSALNMPSITDNQQLNNLTILTSASLTIGSAGSLSVSGSILNNGTFNPSAGRIIFNGMALQTIPSGTYGKVVVNNASGVNLSGNTTLNDSLVLVNGKLTPGNNTLTLAASSYASAGNSNSYVVVSPSGGLTIQAIGAGNKTGNVIAPVGNSNFNPVVLSNTGTSDDFTFGMIDSVCNVYSGNTPIGARLNTGAVSRTWLVNEAVIGGSNISMTLQWATSNELSGFARNASYVSRYATNAWNPIAAAAASGSNPYTLSRTGIAQLGVFAIASGGVLPVVWLNVLAKRVNADVYLQWQTASESNCSHYEIYRSEDGKNYKFIHLADAVGNTQTISTYGYWDRQVSKGQTIYYRIKQVDIDGSDSWSEIVNVSAENDMTGITVFPNPFTDYVFVNSKQHTSNEYILYDITGKVVLTQKPDERGNAVIDMRNIATGVYILRVENEMIRLVKE